MTAQRSDFGIHANFTANNIGQADYYNCSANCEYCVGAYCTACAAGYKVHNYSCVDRSAPNFAQLPTNNSLMQVLDCGQISKCSNCKCGVCIQCEANYELSDGDCKLIRCTDPHCRLCSNYTTCAACQDFYQFDQNKVCVKIGCLAVPGCLECAFEEYCFRCEEGFELVDGYCLMYSGCPPQCTGCLASGVCITCAEPYFQYGGRCLQTACLEGCAGCELSDNEVCAVCQSGHELTPEGACIADNCNDVCPRCDLDDGLYCSKCKYGLLRDDVCYAQEGCMQGCNLCLYWNRAVCHSCNTGYFLNSTISTCCFVSTIIDCSCAYNASFCGVCIPNRAYDLQLNQCVTDLCPDAPNCVKCNSVNPCLLCAPDYILTGNTACHVAIPNCLEQVNTVCRRCAAGFSLRAGGTGCDSCALIGCDACSAPSQCTTCADKYQPRGQVCYLVVCFVDHCELCNAYSTCLTCKANFTLSGSGTECQCGPSRFVANGQCLSCQDNCLECKDLSTCLACKAPTQLVAGSCVPCYKCQRCDRDGLTCLKCEDSYYLLEGVCLACDDNCLLCPTAGICLKCKDQYLLVHGECVPKGVVNVVACPSGMFLTLVQSCTACPAGCSECVNARICWDCDQDYVLEGYECMKTDQQKQVVPVRSAENCAQEGEDACVACGEGFFRSGTDCAECAPLCQTCKDAVRCETCKYGLLLEAESCVGQCSPGFYVQDKVCLRCTSQKCFEHQECCADDPNLINPKFSKITAKRVQRFKNQYLMIERILAINLNRTTPDSRYITVVNDTCNRPDIDFTFAIRSRQIIVSYNVSQVLSSCQFVV